MMRNKLLVALTVLMVAVLGQGSVHAETVLDRITKDSKPTVAQKAPKKEEPKIIVHVVVEGDTLTSLSDAHTTPWKRVWDKNPILTNPDVIKPGDSLIIPQNDEVLADRPVPTPVIVAPTPTIPAQATSQPFIARGAVSGNSYEPGQCTWYVKNKRPDLPNDLGNASSWIYAAQAHGLSTGSVPRVGAVGQSGGHVVYVESVNSDGSVNISDMNGRWVPWEIGHYTYPASKYTYIY